MNTWYKLQVNYIDLENKTAIKDQVRINNLWKILSVNFELKEGMTKLDGQWFP